MRQAVPPEFAGQVADASAVLLGQYCLRREVPPRSGLARGCGVTCGGLAARVHRNPAARSQSRPGAKDAAQDGWPGPMGKRRSIAPACPAAWGAGSPVWGGRQPRHAGGLATNPHKRRFICSGGGGGGGGRKKSYCQ